MKGGQAQFIAQPVPKNTRDARINGLLEYLQQHIREPHNLDSLAQVAAMSRRTLTRHFAKATGMGIADWLAAERLRRSQILLEAGDLPVGQVAEEVGYRSAVTWRQQFKARFGVSPAEWRRTFSSRGLAAERGAVDDEAVFHVAFNHPLPGLVNLVAAYQLYIGDDTVLGAEIEHLLRFRNAANHRPGNRPALHDEAEHFWRVMRRGWRTHQCHRAVAFQQCGEHVEVMRCSNGVEDEIEALCMGFHFAGMTGDHNFICTKRSGGASFGLRRGKGHDMRAHGVRQLDPHMPQPADTDHPDPFAGPACQ